MYNYSLDYKYSFYQINYMLVMYNFYEGKEISIVALKMSLKEVSIKNMKF